ncbi:MAG: serine/threonine-protein kinase [Acidobacteriota bacterium]
MTADDPWRALEALFHRAAETPPGAEREALLEAADPRAAAEVRSLLRAEDSAGDRVDSLAQEVVSHAVDHLNSASTDAPAPELEIPDSIGPYRVLEVLGRGGFGTVFLGEKIEENFRLEVAIKLVHAGLGLPDVERRLVLERRILARLVHPNIARLLDGGTTRDGRPFLVMERVEGEPIDAFCDRRRLGTDERLARMLDVCSAIAYAHRTLVIQRDIKPSNTLVTDDGTVKLLDFGIAKLLDPEADSVSQPALTLTGQLPFTPSFASPEQVRGEALGTATDVYSLGALLYRLLTGHPPYRLEPPWVPSKVEKAVCEETPARLSEVVLTAGAAPEEDADALAARRDATPQALARRLRGDLDNIVAKALRKEPERRYASVQELADDIRRHLAHQPVLAAGDSWGYVIGRFARRHRLAVASALLVLLVLTGGIVSTTVQMHEAQRHRARTDQVMDLLLDDVFGSASPERAQGDMPSAREILDRSAGDLDRRLLESPDLHATLLVALGRISQRLGVYDRALVLLQRGLDRRRVLDGAEHPETLASASLMADALADLGHHQAARGVLLETAEAQRLGRDSEEDLASSLYRLGLVELDMGENEAADEAFAEALRLRRRVFGAASLQAAEVLAARAKVERALGRLEDAESSVREALEIRLAAHGERHPDVLISFNDLAVLLQDRGDLETAEKIFRRVIELHERVHGGEHRNLANALANLGFVVDRRGRPAEAIPIFERALSIYRTTALKKDHTLVASARRNLARCYQQTGGWEQAEGLLLANAARCLRTEGEHSVCSARATLDLGSLLRDRGRFADAAERFAEAQEKLDALLSEDGWPRFLARLERGAALLELGEVSRAEPLLLEAAGGFERTLGPEHPQTQRAREQLRRCRERAASAPLG